MTADETVLVQRMYAAFREAGDVEAVLPFFDPAVEWNDDIVSHSTLHGHDGFRRLMENLASEGYVTEADPEAFEELGDGRVLARGYIRLIKSESYTDLPAFWAFEIRDGLIVRGGGATRRREAFQAIGLAE